MKDGKTLLREYVQTLINEDDTGGAGYGGGYADMSGMLGGWGFGMMNYGPSIKNWAIDPFLDLGKVFKASATKLATRVKTLAKVVLESTLTTAIPFLESNYRLIFDQEKKELAAIRDKYKEAFAAVDKAFTEDVKILSFMISPTAFVSTKVAAATPGAVMSMLEVFAHGSENIQKYLDDVRKRLEQIHSDLTDDISKYKIDQKGSYVPKNQRGPYLTQKRREQFKAAGIMDALEFDDETIFEDAQAQQQDPDPRVRAYMNQVLSDPNLKKMIESSPLARQMQQDAYRIATNLSSKIMQEAQKVMSVKTLENLQAIVKKPLGVEKLNQLQPQEKQQAEQALVAQVKMAMKQFYVKTLEGEINNTLQKGVPSNNVYIQTLQNTLAKINSLK